MRRFFVCLCWLTLSLVLAQQSGLYGQLQAGQVQLQSIAAAPADGLVYHTYQINVPSGTQQLNIQLTDNGQDLDLAAKAGAEITDYETDVDAIDVSETANPVLSIANPKAGTWYLDVINFYQRNATYQLEVEMIGSTTQTQAPAPQVQTPSPTSGIPLEGSWQYYNGNSFSINTLDFLADGSYRYTEVSEFSNEAVVTEEGRYAFDGQVIHFKPWCGEAASIRTKQQGQDIITNFDDGSQTTWSFVPNSDQTIASELTALYNHIEQESKVYEARTPLAPISPGPSPQEPGITDRQDPEPQNIFTGATAFAQQELYNYYSEYYWYRMLDGSMSQTSAASCAINPSGCEAFRDTRHGTYRDQLTYLFFPNGRFYYSSKLYGVGADTSTNPVTPAMEAAWGRYRIDGDEIRLESAIENRTATLLNGRRYLSGDICVPEIEWDLERNQQQ